MTRTIAIVGFLPLISAFGGQALASIASTSGDAIVVSPPPSVNIGEYESDTEMRVFFERQNLQLLADVAVNISSPGLYDESDDLTPSVISAATLVNSYFFHCDPVGEPPENLILEGSATFSQEILGVIILDEDLRATDDTLGHPGTLYPSSCGLNFGTDYISVEADMRTVYLHSETGSWLDQMRIVTTSGYDVATIWQIGMSDGAVDVSIGGSEFAAPPGLYDVYAYNVDADPDDEINAPNIPGILGDEQTSPDWSVAQDLDVIFTLEHAYDAAVVVYERYGSENNDVLLDDELIASLVGPGEGVYESFDVNLGTLSPGVHTLTVRYTGGGAEGGHWIDALRLKASLIWNVTGSQRGDASKLVHVGYELGHQLDSYSVAIEVSDDAGQTWSITPTAVWGDVGEGVVPGDDRHISWNPAIDIPGVGGDNFMVRVIADGVYYADSNVFSIAPAGPGDLIGTVRDQATGDPVIGADVSVNSEPPVQTDDFGYFGFTDVPAGQATVDVTATGYYPLSQTVQIREESFTDVNVLLTPDTGFGVVSVHGQYCNPGTHVYYLNGVNLTETFTATIDWGSHGAGEVHWITPGNTHIDDCAAGETTVSRNFNMGSAFGEGGTLKVKAVGADLAESFLYPVNFDVIPPPPLVAMIPTVYYQAVPSGESLEYQVKSWANTAVELATWDGDDVDSDFPLFGGTDMDVGMEFGKAEGDDDDDDSPFAGELSGNVDSQGKMTLFTAGWSDTYKKTIRKGVRCRKGIKLPFVEVSPTVSAEFNFAWSDPWNDWMPGGGVEVGCHILYTSPQVPVGVIIFIPVYARAEVDLDLLLEVGIDGWDEYGPLYYGSFDFEPLAKAVVGAGIADTISVEVYFGGGFHGTLVFLPEQEWQNVYIILVGGIRADIGPWWHPSVDLRWEYPEQGKNRGLLSLDDMLRDDEWELLPRERYLKYRQGEGVLFRAPTALRDGIEAPIELAVFPYSTPDVTSITGGVLGVWLADNTRRDLINRTEVRYATHDGASWSPITAIAADGTADLNPKLISLPDGDAVCVWQNADTVLSDEDPFDVFLSHLEIAVATYDATGDTWSTPTMLTTNGYLDRSAAIAASDPNDMLAVWVSNADNDMWGTIDLPNDILWSAYDGISWTAPATIATGLGTILDTSLAYDGTTGTFIFVTDADDDLDTPEDQELWAATYEAGVWSAPVQLTNDTITDAAPRLAYDDLGILRLVWLKGDDIRFAEGTDVENASVVVTPKESMGSKDFELVMGVTGRIALVWNDGSETYHDVWISYYEPTQDAWSQPRQLTFDDAAERFLSGVFDANDDLFCIYDKTQTVYEDREEEINGQIVIVEDVPDAGQSDLYYLTYHMDGDLAVQVEDVNADPPNPLPGTPASITAKIRNIGESPASNIEVAFYEGDPDAGGTLIDVATHGGPLVGGGDAEVSVEWLVPPVTEPLAVYVRVDPDLVQEDRDRSNNTTWFWVLAPDVTVSELRVQAAGNDRLLTARVLNQGSLDASDVELMLRRDAEDGPLLQSFVIPGPIVPGAFVDVSWVWEDIAPIPGGEIDVFAIVDEAESIDEFDEDNNVRSALVTNQPSNHPGDWDEDGDVDIDDFTEFPGCMSGPWAAEGFVMPSQDCLDAFDLDADADVDLEDFASFQRAFGGGGR